MGTPIDRDSLPPWGERSVKVMSRTSMQYKHLGRSGLLVSKVGLGTMNFGDATPETDALGIMDRAVELGVNFFDSADV